MIVLLPTPDDPRSAAVRPAARCACSCSTPFATLRIHHMDDDVAGQRRDVADMCRQVGRKIGLGEKNDRRGAALARHQQVPLETTRVVVAIEAHDDEDDVDIGGDDLLAGRRSPAARRVKAAAPRQDADDDRSILWTLTNGDPVADRRQLRAAARRDASAVPR